MDPHSLRREQACYAAIKSRSSFSDINTSSSAFGKVHLEVKALSASGERRFRASNLHQLQEPDGGVLFLCGFRLELGPVTIAEKYELLRTLIPAEQVAQFEKAIAAAGCPLPGPDAWNATGLIANAPEAWRVNEGFPRVVPAILPAGVYPDGVSDVRYSVSLEAAASHVASMWQVFNWSVGPGALFQGRSTRHVAE